MIRRRPGPVGAMTDAELLAAIRREIAESPFVGEGHKKLRARLALRGIHTSGKRVLRLTREAGLLAPTPQVRKRSRRLHDGTITVTVPDTLWATDGTEAHTRAEGRCAVFAIVDHASGEAWLEPHRGWTAGRPRTCSGRCAASASARSSTPSPPG